MTVKKDVVNTVEYTCVLPTSSPSTRAFRLFCVQGRFTIGVLPTYPFFGFFALGRASTRVASKTKCCTLVEIPLFLSLCCVGGLTVDCFWFQGVKHMQDRGLNVLLSILCNSLMTAAGDAIKVRFYFVLFCSVLFCFVLFCFCQLCNEPCDLFRVGWGISRFSMHLSKYTARKEKKNMAAVLVFPFVLFHSLPGVFVCSVQRWLVRSKRGSGCSALCKVRDVRSVSRQCTALGEYRRLRLLP